MAITYDEKTGTWEVSYSKRHPTTRRPKTLRRKLIKTKAEAQRVYNELVVKIEASFKGPSSDGSLLYKNLLELFFISLEERDYTPKTVENYKLCLNAHTSKWATRPISSITTDEIRHLIKGTLADRSPSQQKNVLKYLRGLFTYAVEKGVLGRNPVPKLKFRTADKIKSVLSEQQLRIFLEKAKEYDHEWYPIWATAVYTGMRNGELYALTWDNVDLDNRLIKVAMGWSHVDGFKDYTKNGMDRMVEIAPPLLHILKELKIKNDDSVFTLPRIDDWDAGRQAEIVRTFLLGINLPRVRFHDLRASWATACLSRGIEPVKVMSAGGWKDIKTMMIYIRKAGISIRGMTDSLNFHDATQSSGKVLKLKQVADE
ncbi:MAG TPA: site-specific integrase [Bdellovibrio sp.]|uniref:tyrosine-type recombinase/integrase n=1 Tax=Bdellovibrio sp. TaxID=28201 RepID=UPI002F20EA05